jgi:hypothetical protein
MCFCILCVQFIFPSFALVLQVLHPAKFFIVSVFCRYSESLLPGQILRLGAVAHAQYQSAPDLVPAPQAPDPIPFFLEVFHSAFNGFSHLLV